MRALVSRFEPTPKWSAFADPVPESGEVAVQVTGVALTSLVKGQSSGQHYSVKGDKVPFVPGGDGVGRLADGKRVYFFIARKPFGSMAEKTVVRKSDLVFLPEDLDDLTAASIANPAMSSWAALVHRAHLQKGETVLINGATGVSGKMAIRIARYLGAGHIIVTGRERSRLEALGADDVLVLDDSFKESVGQAMGKVSVVLDYLWGNSAEAIIEGAGRTHSDRPIRFVQIGNMSGAAIQMPASALRAAGLTMMGSGLGSVNRTNLLQVIGEAMQVAVQIGLDAGAIARPMSEAESVWNSTDSARVVFTL